MELLILLSRKVRFFKFFNLLFRWTHSLSNALRFTGNIDIASKNWTFQPLV